MILYDDSSSDMSSSSEEDDLDMLLCELAFAPKPVRRPLLHLQDLSDVECEELFRYCNITKNENHCVPIAQHALFRFLRDDLERLGRSLNLPEKYTCSQGTHATGMEALLIMLRRLSYPNRWCDLVPRPSLRKVRVRVKPHIQQGIPTSEICTFVHFTHLYIPFFDHSR